MCIRDRFMGTPDFAVPSLKALVAAGHDVVGVVCQPDRPRAVSYTHLLGVRTMDEADFRRTLGI